ncbi:sigma 54-interacting transcriptional regulator [Polyangium mundeleinium]|uniref:Sigma 54-interacting transcriptional regulator n=1 Tax=Polyangium mundeleinium TaxID=2995306 RepID=A0ABT5EZ13_9BACT|nr:sigma 54-interacting transcriptional regulator [Polyangium mundeleinium]MDC0747077.1 sigma 54-interacting transcriptional regulator [Polyangium mundeleinium]
MPQLVSFAPGQGPLAIDLHVPLVVGRDPLVDLPILDQLVSRRHACFEPESDQWFVRDLGSANGTFVKGVRVDRARLAHGDVIDIGAARLVFQEEEGAEIVLARHETQDEAATAGRSSQRLTVLYEVTRAINTLEDPDALLGRMLEAVLDLVGGERALVALVEGPRRDVLRRIMRVRGGLERATDEIVVSRTMVQALLERREAVIVREGRGRGAPHTHTRQTIMSAIGAPLEVSGRVLGFLYVDDRYREERFSEEDLDFLNALGRMLAAALDGAERLQRASALAEAASSREPIYGTVGQSPPIQKLRVQVARYAAASGANVLIRGESGTGKELVARALHAASPRARMPFVPVNCAAIPETMIEGVLFGYDKGAFTGAAQRRRGQFALANRGTLFLDEIGDLGLSAQAKVLRALQEGELAPLGAETPVRVDVRVFAATHKDLRQEIAAGRFREDLYYRLNVLQIEVPALRERGADIELLAQMFLEAAALNLNKRLGGFSAAARAALVAYPWPGNVRELRNEVERAVVQAEGAVVELDDLSTTLRTVVSPPEPAPPPSAGSLAARFAALEPTERTLVEEALATTNGNLSEAARLLGITRIMMRRRVERFGLRCRDT